MLIYYIFFNEKNKEKKGKTKFCYLFNPKI